MSSLEWRSGSLRFIDQTKLPHEELYIETTSYRDVGEAIRRLQIRGAPAIGVAAAYALVLCANDNSIDSLHTLNAEFYNAINFLSQTRPTAVNLFGALGRMRRTFEYNSGVDLKSMRHLLLMEARNIQQEDVDACRRIGEFGARLITNGATILTHCNTGALATSGTGTAQSIITTAAKQGKVTQVFVDETRPLFQGARLTAWELSRAGIDVTLITDSTAGLLMQNRGVDCVIVGADRIAANGDTANKIGTYVLAVLAHRHGIPFYVAAPMTTVDRQLRSGGGITIEERDPDEVTHVNGVRVAANGVNVYAPAFDITPNDLISAIITDLGVLKPPFTRSLSQIGKEISEEPEPTKPRNVWRRE